MAVIATGEPEAYKRQGGGGQGNVSATRGARVGARSHHRCRIQGSRWHAPCALGISSWDQRRDSLPNLGEGRRGKVELRKGLIHMAFKVGETVVYPHHGAALIEAVEMRKIKGEDREYLVLRVAQGDLTVRVPSENVDLVGVRDVVDAEGLERVFGVLRQPYTEEPTNWSRRYKANLEKLSSGDVIKVAEVVRDLWRREQDRGLSAGEKRMLAKARQILVSELALAEKTDEIKAEEILDEVLAS